MGIMYISLFGLTSIVSMSAVDCDKHGTILKASSLLQSQPASQDSHQASLFYWMTVLIKQENFAHSSLCCPVFAGGC